MWLSPVVLNWKQGKRRVIDYVLAILGLHATGVSLAFWAGCCRLWVRALFLYMVWPVPIFIFGLSQIHKALIPHFHHLPPHRPV